MFEFRSLFGVGVLAVLWLMVTLTMMLVGLAFRFPMDGWFGVVVPLMIASMILSFIVAFVLHVAGWLPLSGDEDD